MAEILIKEVPSQESVASKSAKFSTVKEADGSVKDALASKEIAKGLKLVGKKGSFTGVVDHVFSPKHNKSVYINFSDPFKNTISGHVYAEDYKKFPNLKDLKGKRVVISGTFSAYQETHPEIKIKDLSQLKIVESAKK